MAGMIKRFASAGADLLEEFYGKTPTERLRTASERATYDPVDGGLGLAPGNTSEERANLMFPQVVYHGGRGTAARTEQPHHAMFLSSNPDLASTYSGFQNRYDILPNMMNNLKYQTAPDFGPNLMKLRLRDNNKAVVDFDGRTYGGIRLADDTNRDVAFEDNLNDIMIEDEAGQGLMRVRREIDEKFGDAVTRMYAPDEDVVGELNPGRSFSTNYILDLTRRDMNQFVPYDIPDLVHMKNVIDVGPGYGQLTKDQQKIVMQPHDVYVPNNPAVVRSAFAAFDPLLKFKSGLSLGASATAVGALLDQLPPDEARQGALYAEGER